MRREHTCQREALAIAECRAWHEEAENEQCEKASVLRAFHHRRARGLSANSCAWGFAWEAKSGERFKKTGTIISCDHDKSTASRLD